MKFKDYINEKLSQADIELLRKRGKVGKNFTGFKTIRSGEEDKSKKAKPEKAKPENDSLVKVGDIFYNSWGYDQTNIDWYQVVDVTKTGKSVKVRPIAGKITGGGPGSSSMSGQTIPVPNKFTGPAITKKIRITRGEPNLPFKHGWTPLWDGIPKYVSWYA